MSSSESEIVSESQTEQVVAKVGTICCNTTTLCEQAVNAAKSENATKFENTNSTEAENNQKVKENVSFTIVPNPKENNNDKQQHCDALQEVQKSLLLDLEESPTESKIEKLAYDDSKDFQAQERKRTTPPTCQQEFMEHKQSFSTENALRRPGFSESSSNNESSFTKSTTTTATLRQPLNKGKLPHISSEPIFGVRMRNQKAEVAEQQVTKHTEAVGCSWPLDTAACNRVTTEKSGTASGVPHLPRKSSDTTVTMPRRVSFPKSDNELVTGYLEPANPWVHGKLNC